MLMITVFFDCVQQYTPLLGKTDGLLVMSFPKYPQKGNVFPRHTSFINPWVNVKKLGGFLSRLISPRSSPTSISSLSCNFYRVSDP